MLNTEIRDLSGAGALEALELYDKEREEHRQVPVDALFVNIGVIPNTQLFKGELALDEDARIVAGEDCRTNISGVFAAGDVRTKPVRQLTTAAADGTVAAILAEKYIQSLKEEE